MGMASVVGSASTASLRLRGFLGPPSSLPASSSAAAAAGGRSVSICRRSRLVVRAKVEPSEKSVEVMRKFSEQYARRSGTYFCVDKGVTAVVIQLFFLLVQSQFDEYYDKKVGLAEHRDSVGAPLCPCRHYDDKAAEVGQGFWNCPCVPMRERKECHCMLFLTPDNDFAGKEQAISLDEIKETTSNL